MSRFAVNPKPEEPGPKRADKQVPLMILARSRYTGRVRIPGVSPQVLIDMVASPPLNMSISQKPKTSRLTGEKKIEFSERELSLNW